MYGVLFVSPLYAERVCCNTVVKTAEYVYTVTITHGVFFFPPESHTYLEKIYNYYENIGDTINFTRCVVIIGRLSACCAAAVCVCVIILRV